jgi:hypothetical protein
MTTEAALDELFGSLSGLPGCQVIAAYPQVDDERRDPGPGQRISLQNQ